MRAAAPTPCDTCQRLQAQVDALKATVAQLQATLTQVQSQFAAALQDIHRPRRVKDTYRIRRPGAGRKRIEVNDPGILTTLERLLTDEVAGDPMGKQKKW